MRILIAALVLSAGAAHADDVPAPAVAKSLTLPAKYDQSQLCGGGRFLALRLVEGGGIVLVDVAKRTIAHTIEKPPADAIVCGGRDVLLLVSPGRKLLMRYRLGDEIRRDKVAALPYEKELKLALMGGNANGPLLLGGEQAVLVDVETLKPMTIEGNLIGQWSRYWYVARVSADGRTFTGIPQGYGAVSYTRMTLDNARTTTATFGSTSYATRWAQPTAGGHLMLLPGGGLFGPHLEPARVDWLNGSTLFPTVDPRYFLSVRFVAENGGFTTRLAICTTADRRIVAAVRGLPEMVPRGNTNARNGIARRLVEGERRYHWVPESNTLITLPYDDRTIDFRELDLDATLEATGEPYVIVDSVPRVKIGVGETYEYEVEVRSSGRKPKFELLDGPEGMRLAKKGKLVWKVPPTEPAGRHTVLVGVSNGEAEAFHTFELQVVPSS